MKDKKQIEEMAKVMHDRSREIAENPCGIALLLEQGKTLPDDYAKALYNANCRILYEDSVVLSKEEYSDYLILQKNHEFIREKAKELQADNERLNNKIEVLRETITWYDNDIKKIYKKTAKRDFNSIIKALETKKASIMSHYGVKESVGADIAIRTVKELAKQYGVEIKE